MTKQEHQQKALEIFNTAFERLGKGLEEFRDPLDSSITLLRGVSQKPNDYESQTDYKNSLKNDY